MKHFFANQLRQFHRDARGNVFILVALAAIPMIALAGLAMDYSTVLTAKTKLNASLDAAAVSAIAKTMSDLQSNIDQTTAISDGEAQGAQAFKANAGRYGAMVSDSLSVVVSPPAGQTVTATASYTAAVPTNFGGIFNIHSWQVAGSSTSSLKMPLYIDFYMLLDVSGSMGIPSTTSEQSRLALINPDQKSEYPTGCTLACHFTTYPACDGHMCQGFLLTRPTDANGKPEINSICAAPGTSSCIQLRLDAIGTALTGLLADASQTEQVTGRTNQFRVGLYPFIVDADTNYQPLSSDLTGVVTTQANLLPSLLDTGNSSDVKGSGGTNINNALNDLYNNTLPSSPGAGANANSPLPFVFLITDGAQDNQTMTNSDGAWTGSNHATTLTQANCTTIKTRATLAILYVPYATIPNPNPSFANDEDDAANDNIPNIPPSLVSCASPNSFYTASSPADIASALQLMFNNSLQMAPRLVQ